LLLVAKWATQLWLAQLNQRHVLRHADAVPEPFRDFVDPTTYARSVQYTLAKSRLNRVELTYDLVVLLVLLFSGILPRAFGWFSGTFGDSVWFMAAFLFGAGFTVALMSWPFEWYAQFHLEQRFGFNTSTRRLWWLDRGKGLFLAVLLGYPLLVLILKLVEWAGEAWWLWAWAAVFSFQLVVALLAPVLILPLFNKFTPLPEGSLRDRLLELADKTGFRTRGIEVMDGSKRSRHSNAFFTGFGRFRKIVLFDTLIQQLSEAELAAVLAHEIGHFKKRHIQKMLAWSAVGSLVGFYLLAVLARQDWFYGSFGFAPGQMAIAVLLFGLLAGALTFWLSPLASFWSRRFEYQADAYAAKVIGEAEPLILALRKLNDKNLNNLTPHALYSGFYYSHPALLEREKALRRSSPISRNPQPAASAA
jgi:STE24 endopeptidase